MPSREPSTALVLSGLDGGNPLAFLAAVGTLRVVTRAAPSAGWTMSWKVHDGHWSPVLLGSMSVTEDGLIEHLMPALKTMDGDPALGFADDLTIGREQFRGVAQDAHHAATPTDRHFADFVAAFGSDSLSVSRKDQVQDTALRTMSGAGHQHFLKSMRELVEATDSIHLKDSLFAPWRYLDPPAEPSLGSCGRSPACVALEESFGGCRADDARRQPACHRGAAPPSHGAGRTQAPYDRLLGSSWRRRAVHMADMGRSSERRGGPVPAQLGRDSGTTAGPRRSCGKRCRRGISKPAHHRRQVSELYECRAGMSTSCVEISGTNPSGGHLAISGDYG